MRNSPRWSGLIVGSLLLSLFPGEIPGRAGGKEEKQPPRRTDLYGDSLPEGVLMRLGTTRYRSPDARHFVFSPDGTLLALAEGNLGIRLLEVKTGKEIRRVLAEVPRKDAGSYALAFSHDGKLLAGGDNVGRVHIWEVSSGKFLRKLQEPGKNHVWAVAFSADRKILTALSYRGNICSWAMDTGKLLRQLQIPDSNLAYGAYSFNGATMMGTSQEGRVRLWDTATAKEVKQLAIHRKENHHHIVSRDGKFLATSDWHDSLGLWEVATGKELLRFEGKLPGFNCIAFSEDGKILAAMLPHRIRLWSTATGKLLREWEVALERWASPLFSPDGKLLAGNDGQAIRFWEVATGKELPLPVGHVLSVRDVTFAPDGKSLASLSEDNTVRAWEVATGKPLQRLPVPHARLRSAASSEERSVVFSPDGATLAASNREGATRLWALPHGKLIHELAGGGPLGGAWQSPAPGGCLAFSPGGRILTVVGDNSDVELLDTATGKTRDRLGGHLYCRLAFSDARTLLSWEVRQKDYKKGPILVWDVATGKRLGSLESKSEWGDIVAMSPDGKTFVAINQEAVHLWEAATGELIWKRLGRFGDSPCQTAFSPDGRSVVLVTGDDTISFSDVATGKPLGKLRSPDNRVTCVAFAPDGLALASGMSDTTILVWDLRFLQPKVAGPPKKLAAKELEDLWEELGSKSASKAYQAMATLTDAPAEVVPFFRERLKLTSDKEWKEIQQLIRDLDSERYADRAAAQNVLKNLGDKAAGGLRDVSKGKPSPELGKRVETLLRGLTRPPVAVPVSELLPLRAIQTLEQIGSDAAWQLLRDLTLRASTLRQMSQAEAALERLQRQRTPAGRGNAGRQKPQPGSQLP